MLTTAEALAAIRSEMQLLDTVTLPVQATTGKVLRQEIQAERDQPPFDRVMMDGVAIAFAEFSAGRRRFPVQATQAAGDPVQALHRGACIEIMTGAALPSGADCIVPVERLSIADGIADLPADYAPEAGQFIHAQGSDYAREAVMLRPGASIGANEIAIMLSCGAAEVEVSRIPSIRVISTGNELVAAGQPIEPHQIRMSNGPAVIAMLEQHGYASCMHEHIVDDPALLEARLEQLLREADVLILSGGVSMGKADYIPRVLETLGVRLVFHKVSQRPGKPMWFGIGTEGQPVFALPGNPVSTLVCCRHYVVPALFQASGAVDSAPQFAALAAEIRFEPKLTNFVPVKLASNAAGQVLAIPVPTNTSGDFASLSGTHGYVELARDESRFLTGTAVPLHRWRYPDG